MENKKTRDSTFSHIVTTILSDNDDEFILDIFKTQGINNIPDLITLDDEDLKDVGFPIILRNRIKVLR